MRRAVSKFGGSSLSDGRAFRRVVGIVHQRERWARARKKGVGADLPPPVRRHVVVSAPGRRHSGDPKVTDLLIDAHAAASVSVEQFDAAFALVADRFSEIYGSREDVSPLLRTALDVTATSIYDQRHNSEAHATSCGEYLSALVMSEMLPDNYSFIDASELVMFDPHTHKLDFPQTMRAMQKRLVRDAKPDEGFVVPGFYGSEVGNRAATVTFSRGGSDVTASLIAAALAGSDGGESAGPSGAEIRDCSDDFVYYHENFTDVDGIFNCDPFVAGTAKRIPQLTFSQVEAMSRAGSRVLHPFAIEPLKRATQGLGKNVMVPLHVRSTRLVAGDDVKVTGEDGDVEVRNSENDGTWVLPTVHNSVDGSLPAPCLPLAAAGLGDRVTVVCDAPFPKGDSRGYRERLLERMTAALENSGIPTEAGSGGGDGLSASIGIKNASRLDDALRSVFASVVSNDE